MFFYMVSTFLIKFDVIDAWLQTSPLEIAFLISQELPNGIWAGFFCSKDMNCPHILNIFSQILDGIWERNVEITVERWMCYYLGNRNHHSPQNLTNTVLKLHKGS
jgi:hypothetical protein